MRVVLLASGTAILGLLWLGPLPSWAQRSFAAHMTMHMGVVAVAAPLLAFGLARGDGDRFRRPSLIFQPVPASVIELVVVWTWHLPALHHLARTSWYGLMLEQSSFLGAGLLLWLAAFGSRNEGRIAAGVVGLLLTSMHMTLLGALLALAPRPLYGHDDGFAGLQALQDQNLGGAIMLLVGGVAYLLGGLGLTRRLVERSP